MESTNNGSFPLASASWLGNYAETNSRTAGMRLTDGLGSDDIIVAPGWHTFDEMVVGMVEHLVSTRRLPSGVADLAVSSIREREMLDSTAMVDIGVSIPHARVPGITGLVAAIAVSPHAVYRYSDDLPISIVALVLSSPQMAGEHLNFLAALSMLLQSARTRDALRRATDAREVYRLVQEAQGSRP